MTPETAAPAPAPPVGGTNRTLMSTRSLALNEVHLDIRGSREVHIEGILDHDGLLELEEKLKALKMLIKKAPAAEDGEGGQPN